MFVVFIAQILQQKIQDCLGLTLSLNLNSIAFPTVGCGNLRYPVDKVARCFTKAVAASNNLKVQLHFGTTSDPLSNLYFSYCVLLACSEFKDCYHGAVTYVLA